MWLLIRYQLQQGRSWHLISSGEWWLAFVTPIKCLHGIRDLRKSLMCLAVCQGICKQGGVLPVGGNWTFPHSLGLFGTDTLDKPNIQCREVVLFLTGKLICWNGGINIYWIGLNTVQPDNSQDPLTRFCQQTSCLRIVPCHGLIYVYLYTSLPTPWFTFLHVN